MSDQFHAESCKSFEKSTELFFRDRKDARRHIVFMGQEGNILIESETLRGILLPQDIVNIYIENNKDLSIVSKLLHIIYKKPETNGINDFIAGEISPQCADEIIDKQGAKYEFKGR